VEKDLKIRLSCIRTVGELSKKSKELALNALNACGITFFLNSLNVNDEETVNAVGYVIQRVLDTLSEANVAEEIKLKKKNPR